MIKRCGVIKRWKRGAAGGILLLLFGFLCLRLLWGGPPRERNGRTAGDQDCQIWYLLNLDGMKGLGHSAMMLVDEQGEGRIYSYNGMQYSLPECLLGREGIGMLSVIALNREETLDFLKTGDLFLAEEEACDNFDRALYRGITREQYETVIRAGEEWLEKEELFRELYGMAKDGDMEAQERLAKLWEEKAFPLYQIYTHNCDTAARELIGLIDEEMEAYNREGERLTPGGNYKGMCKRFSPAWGIWCLGEDKTGEKLLEKLVGGW
ncbi:MAG: hypothetical protein HFI33_14185 [Lachnospiraceae bacterium]|nr:hypothetical protein [Lachnospiraceae bacterium]